MGPCSWDCPRCWVSSVLGFISLLLTPGVCSAVVKSPEPHGPGVKDSGAYPPLEGIRGGAVLFHVTKKPGAAPEADLEKVLWNFGPDSGYIRILEVSRDDQSPSGQYRADVTLTGGAGFAQIFHLMVYEPVPHPHIQAGSPFITSDWCNVTLECNVTVESRTSGTTQNLTVTWKSRDLEQRGAPGPALNSWTLAVSLPQRQPNASFTCVVSNPVDQKAATKDLRDICAQGSGGRDMAWLRPGIIGATVVLMLILGLYLWKTCGKKRKKKLEPGRGAGLQEEHKTEAGDIHYADLMEQDPQGISEAQEKGPLTSVYSEIRNPGQIIKRN
ncbi:SLAM family member 9-like isoform X2 [Otolemur garnettii]|uniref:SLAM family member 9-like isoform X2 n=1 Tax=Otolemur garnettii TaxID=30611 RepID=UPI000C7F1B73|nr:SLAM family member 9-like isoform X2 [Otolemur garnettii]